MVGGRNFDQAARPRLTVALGDTTADEVVLAPGAFLRFVSVPRAEAIGSGRRGDSDYVPVTISTSPPSRVAIEQFDASAIRPMSVLARGGTSRSSTRAAGVRWRWLSERGELKLVARSPRLTLHLEGESPRTYFSRGSRLVVRAAAASRSTRSCLTISLDVPSTRPRTARCSRDRARDRSAGARMANRGRRHSGPAASASGFSVARCARHSEKSRRLNAERAGSAEESWFLRTRRFLR